MVAISDVSTVTFRSDQGGDSHNSTGVVHGIRYIDDGTPSPREQNVFCWVRDAQHIEAVGEYLKKRKFAEHTLVFVPYSTRDNWIRRYPLAVPTLECTKEGVIVDREKVSSEAQKPLNIPTIAVKVEKRTRREFDDYFKKLVEFKATYGHVDGECVVSCDDIKPRGCEIICS